MNLLPLWSYRAQPHWTLPEKPIHSRSWEGSLWIAMFWPCNSLLAMFWPLYLCFQAWAYDPKATYQSVGELVFHGIKGKPGWPDLLRRTRQLIRCLKLCVMPWITDDSLIRKLICERIEMPLESNGKSSQSLKLPRLLMTSLLLFTWGPIE